MGHRDGVLENASKARNSELMLENQQHTFSVLLVLLVLNVIVYPGVRVRCVAVIVAATVALRVCDNTAGYGCGLCRVVGL
jgi:hypothetical protein